MFSQNGRKIEMSKKEKWLKFLEDNQPLTVATHDDADGIYSQALFSTVFKIGEVRIPKTFGDYGYKREDGESPLKENVGLDLGQPISKEFEGVAIDHHTHPEPVWYHLVHRNYPTGLIIYELFKDNIPENQRWKVAGSLVGDGSAERIPPEIWEYFEKELLEKRGRIYPQYKVNPKIYKFLPVYKLLSAPVNACCRAGYPMEALKIVSNSREPSDILEHPTFKEMAMVIRQDEENIWKEYGINGAIQLKNDIALFVFLSKYKMSGRVASKLKNIGADTTWIVINEERGEISVRGDLALYIANKMSTTEFQLGGHPGYVGSKLSKTQTSKDFISALRKVL